MSPVRFLVTPRRTLDFSNEVKRFFFSIQRNKSCESYPPLHASTHKKNERILTNSSPTERKAKWLFFFQKQHLILKNVPLLPIRKKLPIENTNTQKNYLITNYLSNYTYSLSFPNDTAKVRLFLKPVREKGVKNMLYNILFTFIPSHLQIFKDKPPM